MTLKIEDVVAEFEDAGLGGVAVNGHHEALCPGCAGFVTITQQDGQRVALECSTGCTPSRIADQLSFRRSPVEPSPKEEPAAKEVTVQAVSRRFTPRTADLAAARPIRWAWQDFVPCGALSILVGDEGVGKGTLLAHLVARLTRGELPGDLHGRPGRVLIVGDEDHWGRVVGPRLHAAGAVLENVLDLPPSPDGALVDVHRDALEIRQHIVEQKIDLVVFDALLDNLPDKTDPWKASDVRKALAPIRTMAGDLDVAVLASLHPPKGTKERFRDAVGGSQAFNAVARSSLLLAAHPEDEELRVLARGKGNWSKRPQSVEFRIRGRQMEINGHTFDLPTVSDLAASDLTAEDLVTRKGSGTERDRVADWLRSQLADGPVATRDLEQRAQAAGYAWRTVERAKQEIHAVSRPKGSWRLETISATSPPPVNGGGVGGDGGDGNAEPPKLVPDPRFNPDHLELCPDCGAALTVVGTAGEAVCIGCVSRGKAA